jgi:hypothetical protein
MAYSVFLTVGLFGIVGIAGDALGRVVAGDKASLGTGWKDIDSSVMDDIRGAEGAEAESGVVVMEAVCVGTGRPPRCFQDIQNPIPSAMRRIDATINGAAFFFFFGGAGFAFVLLGSVFFFRGFLVSDGERFFRVGDGELGWV